MNTNDLYELIGKVESEMPASETDASGFEKDVNKICTLTTKLLAQHDTLIDLCSVFLEESAACNWAKADKAEDNLVEHLELCKREMSPRATSGS